MEDFQSRFREALRRRLYPNAPLHLKEIAGAIGRSENTVARWWRGETHIAGDDLYRIAQFLARRGDSKFLQDIFVDLLPADAALGSTEEAVLSQIRDVLAEVHQSNRAGRDSYAWITADGMMAVARFGHSDYVRRVLRLPQGAGDLTAYATRVLGWVAVTEFADGIVMIRHDGRRIAPLAAESVCQWLDDRANRILHVRRTIHMEGRWIEAYHPGAHAAAAAIAKVAFIVRIQRRPWVVKPLPLDSIKDARLAELLRVHRQAPDQLVHAAAAMGAFTTSNLLGVSGNDVISHHIGTSLGFDPSDFEGLNVLSRPDTDYALMLQARVLRTRREGANFNELTGTIDDKYVRYLNLALPEPGPMGRVLTSTVILELERIAA